MGGWETQVGSAVGAQRSSLLARLWPCLAPFRYAVTAVQFTPLPFSPSMLDERSTRRGRVAEKPYLRSKMPGPRENCIVEYLINHLSPLFTVGDGGGAAHTLAALELLLPSCRRILPAPSPLKINKASPPPPPSRRDPNHRAPTTQTHSCPAILRHDMLTWYTFRLRPQAAGESRSARACGTHAEAV